MLKNLIYKNPFVNYMALFLLEHYMYNFIHKNVAL